MTRSIPSTHWIAIFGTPQRELNNLSSRTVTRVCLFGAGPDPNGRDRIATASPTTNGGQIDNCHPRRFQSRSCFFAKGCLAGYSKSGRTEQCGFRRQLGSHLVAHLFCHLGQAALSSPALKLKTTPN